ncbi:MAG: DUF349 domain-containing protein [Flavobacterium sp.]|uniref:DUF349 domain-containing protein n=1 Tax=Flavobacterium sp. TaxID=239 RepID=UPI003BD32EAF
MLEEKNDNLLNADGSLENESHNVIPTENQEIIDLVQEKIADTIDESEQEQVVETPVKEVLENFADVEKDSSISEQIQQIQNEEVVEAKVAVLTEELTEDEIELATEKRELVEETIEEFTISKTIEKIEEDVDDILPEAESERIEEVEQTENESVISAIEDANAEESEDESLKERHDIPMLEYETLSMEQLVKELTTLVAVEKLMSVKDHIEELKKSFLSKYYLFIDEKKEEFHTENPDNTEDFHYNFPLKGKFDQLYSQYRDNKNTHFKSLQNDLKANLENRLAIVEELKSLIQSQDNIPVTLKKFNDIRDRWKVAGPIPKDKYNHVWNNYHFHLENFYDILHLDREIRDLDFKHNLVQKLKIIERVEELIHEEDINKAFRELQDLHRIWKEEIGPVSRENREEIWNKFSELTKKMHDKREVLFEQLREVETANLEKKKDIIAKIEILAQEKVNSHSAWLGQMEKVEVLRNEFLKTGKVPSEVNEQTWTDFKNAVRNFNSLKNSFYKDIKKEQNDNLFKKEALVAKANELKVSTDFANTTPLFKQIQEEWKSIGHIPRKFSDKLWTDFRAACNEYFDKLKEQKNEANAEEVEAFDKKKTYIETLKSFELVGDHKADLDAIKLHIETWKSFGKVPFARRHIEGKFNKILDAFFEKLSLSKKDNEMVRYANKLDHLASTDSRKLDNEKVFIIRKVDEVQAEIFQLENNIQFFAKAKADNPMVKEVLKNIELKKEELVILKDKLKQLRNLQSE